MKLQIEILSQGKCQGQWSQFQNLYEIIISKYAWMLPVATHEQAQIDCSAKKNTPFTNSLYIGIYKVTHGLVGLGINISSELGMV